MCSLAIENLESRTVLSAVAVAAFPVPSASSNAPPAAIVSGPDGNIWFTANNSVEVARESIVVNGEIGRVNPTTGVVTTFPVPGGLATAGGLAVGPDGNLWFTLENYQSGLLNITQTDPHLGEINIATGVITEFAIPNIAGQLTSTGGKFWFTEGLVGKIGTFDPTTQATTEFPLDSASSGPLGITLGPDGNLWFTESAASKVGSINPTTHAIAEFATPTANSQPSSIVTGPDGNLWFTEVNVNKIGEIAPTTAAISEFSTGLPGNSSENGPSGPINVGSDGNLYFTGGTTASRVIASINPSTKGTTASLVPITYGGPTPLTSGPDGNLWLFSNQSGLAGESAVVVKAALLSSMQAAIQGNVYSDELGDGAFENPQVGVTAYVDLANSGHLQNGDPTSITDVSGNFSFIGLAPGTYTVRLRLFPGEIASGSGGQSRVVTLVGQQVANLATIGIVQSSSTLPLTLNTSPFGTHNPDVSTAEVNGLYNIILGRAPDAVGGAAAIAYLNGGGTLQQLAANLINSPEYETGVVASYYVNFLGRAGTTAEINAWVAQLQAGMSEDEVATKFLSSTEYSALHPSSSDFVQSLYNNILGRQAGTSEVAFWVSSLNNGASPLAVIQGILGSTEADTRAVDGFYSLILSAVADSAGEMFWINGLQNGATQAQIVPDFFGSAQFLARANATVG